MTMTRSTDSGISLTTNLHAVKQMLEHAEPHICLDKVAKQIEQPKNKKETVQFRRPVPFTASTTPLTEGVTPTARAFSYETVSATLKQYGDLVEITDVIADTAEDPVLRDATMIAGENVGRTREALLYGVLKAGSNVQYANGTGRGDVNTTISLNGLRGVVRTLRANKAKPVTRVLDGSVNIGTVPVEAAFVAFCHTDCAADIRGLNGFIPSAEYGQRKLIHPNELGSVEDVRFICSADLEPIADVGGTKGAMKSTTGTDADVYPIIVVGQDAYGAVALKGMHSITPTIVQVDKADKADPLAQRGYVGWKTYFAAMRLNETWMVRYEVAVTAL